MMRRSTIVLASSLLLASCHGSLPGKVLLPEQTITTHNWSEADRKKDIAIAHLHRTAHSSTHLIRLQGSEPPHYHDHHDLTVVVLSGNATIHFQNRKEALKPGDVLHIPKGHYHWAENTGNEASIVFAQFSPAFDGKDRRRATQGQ